MLKNRGFTFISVLIIFFLLAGTTWNLFFVIKNFKEQEKILEENVEIFYRCNFLSKESFFQEENYKEIYVDDVLYIVEKNEEELLVKTTVSAYQGRDLRKKIFRYKYLYPGGPNEEI